MQLWHSKGYLNTNYIFKVGKAIKKSAQYDNKEFEADIYILYCPFDIKVLRTTPPACVTVLMYELNSKNTGVEWKMHFIDSFSFQDSVLVIFVI